MNDSTPESDSYEMVNKSERESSGEETSPSIETISSKTAEDKTDTADQEEDTADDEGRDTVLVLHSQTLVSQSFCFYWNTVV